MWYSFVRYTVCINGASENKLRDAGAEDIIDFLQHNMTNCTKYKVHQEITSYILKSSAFTYHVKVWQSSQHWPKDWSCLHRFYLKQQESHINQFTWYYTLNDIIHHDSINSN
jgi:hypothetical protein